ncbi:MAG: ABC transporter substrate-binding protein [Dehalococcoidia bacterium]|nr:ABC transporter substrate-binding protein [Dehalococcoidia bacterium]
MSADDNYWERWHRRTARRRGFLQLSGMTAVGAAALAAVGCGDDDANEDVTPTTAGGGATTTSGPGDTASPLPDHPFYKGLAGGKRGGKYVFALSEDVIGADPHSHEEPSSLIAGMPSYNHLFFPWVEGPPTQVEVLGELVEEWEQPSDTELILHLRKGVTFQDVAPLNGRPFTSKDVEYNMQRMRDTTRPENRLRGMFDVIESTEAQDDYTVRMKLSQPFAPLFSNLAFTWAAMVAREVVEAGNIEKTPIGTGPFILDKWDRGIALYWKRNPNYWKPGLPLFDEVEGQIIRDRAVRDAKLLAKEHDVGSVQVLGSSKETIEKQMAEVRDKISGVTFVETPGAVTSMLKTYTNLAVKPFDDPRVRQAITFAMPYDQMIQTYFGGRAMRTGPSSSANIPWAMRSEDLPPTDIAKAKQLLQAAGYADGFKTEAWVSPAGSYGGAILGPIVAGLLKKALGIEIELKQLQDAEWLAEVYRGKGAYPMTAQVDWSFDDPDRTLREYYSSKGSAQHQNINDAELDAMLEKQRAELDTKARQVLIQDIQKHIIDNGYMTPLLTQGSIGVRPPWTHIPDIRTGNSNAYRVRDIGYLDGGPRGPSA